MLQANAIDTWCQCHTPHVGWQIYLHVDAFYCYFSMPTYQFLKFLPPEQSPRYAHADAILHRLYLTSNRSVWKVNTRNPDDNIYTNKHLDSFAIVFLAKEERNGVFEKKQHCFDSPWFCFELNTANIKNFAKKKLDTKRDRLHQKQRQNATGFIKNRDKTRPASM